MRIGEIIRYPAKIVKDLHVDGLRSWYSLTAVPDARRPTQEVVRMRTSSGPCAVHHPNPNLRRSLAL